MNYLSAFISLLVLSILLVMCSEAFKRRNQNWPMIIACSFGMPVFMVIISGLVGSLFH